MSVRPHRADLAGLALLLLALPAGWAAPRAFFAGWLTAWWCALGLLLGAMANLHIHALSGGRWGEVLRPAGLQAARRLPLALLLGLPLALGLQQLYPWAADPRGWSHHIAQPAFPRWWLQPGFFAMRLSVYAALWVWLARPTAQAGRAAAALALYLLSGTLASVDLLMSLVPGWFSTAFGLVVLSGQALGGAALMTLAVARQAPQALGGRPPLTRDLGNLLLMWLMTWAYLAFMEFLIIWAENLPAEIAWFVPRLQTGWVAAGVALVIGQFALPLLALLQRPLKDRPERLAWISALLLATQLLNTAWLVLPSVAAGSALACALVPLLALGMGLLLFGGMAREVRHAAA